MSIFDVPANRIFDLSDTDLRELIARLCEAERERQGGARTDVRWGGSQTAADGGLDVVIEAVGPFEVRGILSRINVGIQVKAGDLQPAQITAEMRPEGTLRPSISSLASKGGAYLIASGGNISYSALQRRRTAMREAAADDPDSSDLYLDYLDRGIIARWASEHPSVVAWLL